MANKTLNTRIVHKHDTEANWSKATNFIPLQGEIVVYDVDERCSHERFKIGDGMTNVNLLPFASNKEDLLNIISGNPVQFETEAEYVPNVKIKVEPQQAEGTPSPDNILPITVPETVSITRCGKNLLKYPYFETSIVRSGITYTVRNDGGVAVKGNSGDMASYFVLASNIDIGDTPLNMNSPAANGYVISGTYCTYNPYIHLVSINPPGNTDVDVTVYPQIELGSAATTYEPYQGDTYTIDLPDGFEGGTVGMDGVVEKKYKRFDLAIADMDSAEEYPGWRLPKGSLSECFAEGMNKTFNINTNVSTQISINNKVESISDVAWLSQTSVWGGLTQSEIKEKYPDLIVTVYFPLLEPTQTTIPAQPVPALDGVNTVMTDADSVSVGYNGSISAIQSIESKFATQLININDALDNKVNKDGDKVLSSNDFTDTLLNKLTNINAGAEVNQNAFSTIAVKASSSASATNIVADSKTDTFTIIGGNNITLTPNASGDSLTIASTDTKLSVDTTLNVTGAAADAKTVGSKINAVQNSIDAINTLLDSNDSDLDTIQEIVNYIKENRTDVESITSAKQDKITGAATTITGSNLTASRVLVSDGNGKVAASSSITTTELGYLDGVTSSIQQQINSATNLADEAKTLANSKVDKKDGYGLSANDFTNALKTKLEGIATGANNYSLPTASSSTKGGVKTGAAISGTSGYTAVHVDGNGVIYYKDTILSLDTALTASGKAADAKAVGDKITVAQNAADAAQNTANSKLSATDLSITVSGTGNVITGASYSSTDKKFTLTKSNLTLASLVGDSSSITGSIDSVKSGTNSNAFTVANDLGKVGIYATGYNQGLYDFTNSKWLISNRDSDDKIVLGDGSTPVVGSITGRASLDGNGNNIASTYLPLTGGTLTGGITVNNTTSAGWTGLTTQNTNGGITLLAAANRGLYDNKTSSWLFYMLPGDSNSVYLGKHAYGTIEKANCDAEGNPITTTYATKAELSSGSRNDICLVDKITGQEYVLEIANGQLRSSVKTDATSGITVQAEPMAISSYEEGQQPDTSNITVLAMCEDGTVKEVDNYTCSAVENGSYTITYIELGKTYTATVSLN